MRVARSEGKSLVERNGTAHADPRLPVIVAMSDLRGRLLVPVLIGVALLTSIISSLGAPLIPSIAASYGVSVATAQWSLTVTLLLGAVATPLISRLGDGRQRR